MYYSVMRDTEFKHEPVLLKEVIDILSPKNSEIVVDATLGLGGHSFEFLKYIGKEGRLIGIETDIDNLNAAKNNLYEFCDQTVLKHINFRDIDKILKHKADIIFADLGLSSPHVDDEKRGFSFRFDAPLDLRYDRNAAVPASEWLEENSFDAIYRVLKEYGELRFSYKLAKTIKEKPPKTTFDLKIIAENCLGRFAKKELPQIFQALRIAVNNELESLNILLQKAPDLLKKGGRFGVISYHSLEDRLVKQFFKNLVTSAKDPITGQPINTPDFILLTKKPVTPSVKEISDNPRCRSAKLRVLARK